MKSRFLGSVAAMLLVCGAAHAAGTLRVRMQDDPDDLDPARGGTFAGRIMFASLCDKADRSQRQAGLRAAARNQLVLVQ